MNLQEAAQSALESMVDSGEAPAGSTLDLTTVNELGPLEYEIFFILPNGVRDSFVLSVRKPIGETS